MELFLNYETQSVDVCPEAVPQTVQTEQTVEAEIKRLPAHSQGDQYQVHDLADSHFESSRQDVPHAYRVETIEAQARFNCLQ